ncbi:MAG: UbiD family decarboxylase, partial [Candidatus Thalassarchaeaceae archaeon]|nr:UbiD family decarboxylase [Candidatus Thalassarchaeaceae archaeon]
MGFREMLRDVQVVDELVSVRHEMLELSKASGHQPMILTNVKEAPGHRAALNVVDRQRLCESFGVKPGELIDILAWAMMNPTDPVIVGGGEAPVLENTTERVDLSALPIPWHYPEDGGRYQSASVI